MNTLENSDAARVAAPTASETITHQRSGDISMTHPVGGTYHSCCNAIAKHGAGCAQCVDDAHSMAELAHRDTAIALRTLPDNAPLFATVDIVNAIAHLRAAMRLLDRAATAIERTTAEVR